MRAFLTEELALKCISDGLNRTIGFYNNIIFINIIGNYLIFFLISDNNS